MTLNTLPHEVYQQLTYYLDSTAFERLAAASKYNEALANRKLYYRHLLLPCTQRMLTPMATPMATPSKLLDPYFLHHKLDKVMWIIAIFYFDLTTPELDAWTLYDKGLLNCVDEEFYMSGTCASIRLYMEKEYYKQMREIAEEEYEDEGLDEKYLVVMRPLSYFQISGRMYPVKLEKHKLKVFIGDPDDEFWVTAKGIEEVGCDMESEIESETSETDTD